MDQSLTRAPVAGLLLAALIVQGCGATDAPLEPGRAVAPAAADVSTETGVIPVSFTAFDDCAGELIEFTGVLRFVVHLGGNRGLPAGSQHIVNNATIHLEGVGLTTGRTYRSSGPQQFGFQGESPVNAFPAVQRAAQRFTLTSPGLGVVSRGVFSFMLVLNANGDVTVDRFETSLTCF